MQHMGWKPFVAFGVMVVVMLGLMAAFTLMVGGSNPMALLMSGGAGQGLRMWSVMLVPAVGLLIMGTMMVISFRSMAGRGGPMSSVMARSRPARPQQGDSNCITLTFTIPSVSCDHCKMAIEREVGKLPGVAAVSVDLNTQQAVIQLVSPPTRVEIEELLTRIGYPPQNA